jgi:hypothetical protein
MAGLTLDRGDFGPKVEIDVTWVPQSRIRFGVTDLECTTFALTLSCGVVTMRKLFDN